MRKQRMRIISIALMALLCAGLFSGCGEKEAAESGEHEPLTVITGALEFDAFEKLLYEKYPEVRLEHISYAGSNTSGYLQYLLKNGDIPDIFPLTVFGMPEEQKKNLLDLSGFEFLSNYKTDDINQVMLDGAVYLAPTSYGIIGLYYNKTLFKEHGWTVPQNFAELKQLSKEIRKVGIDPVSAQFDLSGNGFFDLFTLAKTGFLSTSDGLQWEQDFKDGKASAKEGLSESAALLQEMIDDGLLDAEDTKRSYDEAIAHFYNREAAMYLNAGTIERFTQKEDGSGDQYGIMPFLGEKEGESVLITSPLCYFGLSKSLGKEGNEQKLEDAQKVMEVLATKEGQKTLTRKLDNYIAPLKNETIPESSPFYEVNDTIRGGHISNLAYAGYEPIIIDVGNKVRDWVAGKCTGDGVLALADELQAKALSGDLEPVAVASKDFTLEETAQLQAEAFRQTAKTDIGIVSLGGYHDGLQNDSGVCGKLFKGDISQDVVNAVVPGIYNDPVCVLTLTGAEIKDMLKTGFVKDKDVEGFPYIPAGISVAKNADGSVKDIVMADGSKFTEDAKYTVAVDKGGFGETIKRENVKETKQVVVDVIGDYFSAHSPLAPLKPSIK